MTSEVTLSPRKDARKTERSGVDTCWHVPVICALAFVAISVGSENYGFFYVGFMEVFNTSRAAVTLPSTMMSIMLNFAGVLVWALQHWFSIFRIAQTASVLCWISMIASTFAPSMPWMTVTFGVLYGTGLGVFSVSLGIIVVMFFERYRGIACGMRFMGHTISSLLFARILVLMQEKCGFRGTLFLCGAIMMHATALAFLLKKPLWMTERPDAYRIREAVSASNGQTHNALTPTVSLNFATSKKYKNMWRSLNTVRNPMFYVIVIYSAIAGYSKVSFQTTIVDYAMDKGSSLTEAETMVEYFSLSQLVGCLIIPLISDLRFVKRSTLIMINVILLGCTYVSLPHLTSFSYLVPACMLVAMLLGSVASFPTVLMADYLGIDSIPVCWTAVGVASLPLYSCSPMIIGLLRDSIGAYDNFYRFQAAIQFFVGIMLCLVCDSENDRTIPYGMLNATRAMEAAVTLPPTNEERKTPRSGVDTCWHVPVLCALANTILNIGLGNSGFFFVGFMEEFHSNRAAATWPDTLISITLDFSGIAVWVLQRWFSVFKIAPFASALTWIGVIASAFTTSIPWVTFTFGAIYGIGVGTSTISLGIIVVMFFDKRRGIASGIKFSGFTFSSILFARILVLMQETYGFRGTLFLCGAIMINATAFTFLLKKPPWLIEKPNIHKLLTIPEKLPASLKIQKQTVSVPTETLKNDTSKQDKSAWKSSSPIRKSIFYVVVFYTALVNYSNSSFLSTIVDYAMDKGSSLTAAQSLVEYFSVARLVGQIVVPFVSDLRFLKRGTLVTISVILLGCTFLSLPHVTSFSYLVPACLVLAALFGFVTSMPTVLMADYLGVDAISVCWVFVGVASLPLDLCNSMIIGIFRDSMGEYDNFYRLHAGIQFFLGIMLCLVFFFRNDRKLSISKARYVVNK